ncbi:MAG: 23S rRNA (guanosine(2251)-2'-O)-methyltransferase RlmB [Spirochaetes bacterium]|nr:23S rRNA (guanosine(2251)-2'-O)-methyltransferase RlmB [Spirochaetota bacterium]
METKDLIYGRNTVLEYLKRCHTGEGVTVYLAENAHGSIIEAITAEARRRQVPVVAADKSFFRGIGPSSKHQGAAMSVAAERASADAPALLERASAAGGLIILLDQLMDPHNIGSIIRSAEALGCAGVVMTKSHSPGITPTVAKASAGATAHIAVLSVPNAAEFMRRAKEKGFWIIGSSDHGDCGIEKARGLRPAVLVIGSEGAGMRRLTGKRCDCTVAIPLKGRIGSLNASVAAGILLYELLKD